MDAEPTAAQFRDRFPGLDGRSYLASCSQGALSESLAASLVEFQAGMLETVNPWEHWGLKVDEARRRFALMIGADVDEIAVLSNASEGAYQVASGQRWPAGASIVTCDLEFPSIAHVWLAQRQRGAHVRYASSAGGFVLPEHYDLAVDDNCKLVSIPMVSYQHGQVLAVREIADLAHRRGAKVFVDAYQAAGVLPINVDDLGCDYLVAGALKFMLGIPGLAFLYVRAGTEHELEPELTGWFGRKDPFSFDPRSLGFSDSARRFEVGSPPVSAAFAAVAGMKLLSTISPGAVAAHVAGLTARLYDALEKAGEIIASPSDPSMRGPQVAILDPSPVRLAEFLSSRRVVTSPRGDMLRLAVHYYNDETDIDAVVRSIAEYRRI